MAEDNGVPALFALALGDGQHVTIHRDEVDKVETLFLEENFTVNDRLHTDAPYSNVFSVHLHILLRQAQGLTQ